MIKQGGSLRARYVTEYIFLKYKKSYENHNA